MYDASLYNCIRKDGPGPFLQPAYPVHADKQHILNAPGLDLVKYLHPVMFPFCLTDPKPEDIFHPVHIIAQDDIDRTAFGFIFPADGNIQAVYKKKSIKLLQGTALPFFRCLNHSVCDIGYGFVGDFKPVNIFDRISNVPVAHTSCIHRQNLILYAADVFCPFGDRLRFKRSISVSGNRYFHISVCSLHAFVAVAVAAVRSLFITMVVGLITQMGLHLSLKHCFKHRPENIFEGILHLFCIGWLVFINNCLRNCHTGIAAFVLSWCHQLCTHNPFFSFLLGYCTSK